MPDPEYPVSLDQLQATLARRAYPRPASPTSSPVTDRAVEALRKAYPGDMSGVDIQDYGWKDPSAGTDTLGETGVNNAVRLNPAYTATYPQEAVEGTIAHELQHVRQNRDELSKGQSPAIRILQQQSLPYAQRPDEIDAQNARFDYMNNFKNGGQGGYGWHEPVTQRAMPGHKNTLQENLLDSLLAAGIAAKLQ
jgi:hypothetical protein